MTQRKTLKLACSVVLSALGLFSQSCQPTTNDKTEQPAVAEVTTRTNSCDSFVSPCAMPDSCNSTICQAEIRGFHRLRQDSFENMVTRFYEGPIPAGDTFRTPHVAGLLNGADCMTQRLRIFTGAGPMGNQIDIEVTDLKKLEVNYSLQLFKGILQLQPHYFVFYQATKFGEDCMPHDDIVFMAVRHDAAGGSPQVVYYGDASDLLP